MVRALRSFLEAHERSWSREERRTLARIEGRMALWLMELMEEVVVVLIPSDSSEEGSLQFQQDVPIGVREC